MTECATIVAVPLLERLGLSRPELRGWVSYDWANSAFMTSIVQVFQVYFASVVAQGLTKAESGAHFYAATAIAALIVACIGPFVGALADFSGRKKAWLLHWTTPRRHSRLLNLQSGM